MPRILFIAMTESVHTARWLNEIQDLNWDVHLFPSWGWEMYPTIKNVTVHGFVFIPEKADKHLRFSGAFPFPYPKVLIRQIMYCSGCRIILQNPQQMTGDIAHDN